MQDGTIGGGRDGAGPGEVAHVANGASPGEDGGEGSTRRGGDQMGTAFQRWLGLRWNLGRAGFSSAPGSASGGEAGADVEVELALRPDLCGPAGTLEGGVVSTLIDVAGASAAAFAFGGQLVATEHMAISLLAPGRVGPVAAVGTVLRKGRRDAVTEVRVIDRGLDDRLMAVAHVTLRVLESR